MEVRRIFGLKRDEIIGGWRKLLNDKLLCLYSSLNIIRIIKVVEDEMGMECSENGGEDDACSFIVGPRKKETTRKT
jgi:hypothetical protein